MRKPGTHFEQVPIVVVKRIAEREMSVTKQAGTRGVMVKAAAGKSKPAPKPRSASARSPRREGR